MIDKKIDSHEIEKVNGGTDGLPSKIGKTFNVYFYKTVDDMMANLCAEKVGEAIVLEDYEQYVIVKGSGPISTSNMQVLANQGFIQKLNEYGKFRIDKKDDARVYIGIGY